MLGHRDGWDTILCLGSSQACTGTLTQRRKLLYGGLNSVEGGHEGGVVADLEGRGQMIGKGLLGRKNNSWVQESLKDEPVLNFITPNI